MTRKQAFNLIFHKDTIALFVSLFFLWFTISLLADTSIDKNDLLPQVGTIVQIDSVVTVVKDKPLFKEITKELQVTLDVDSKYFTSLTTTNFGNITSHITLGDTVTIFTKPRLWRIFGLKKINAINHLTKGDTIVIDFAKYQMSISGFSVLTLIGSIVFFIFYYVRTRRRYVFDISSNP